LRAGSVSAAALHAVPVSGSDELSPEHCPRLEYTGFVAQQAINPQYHLRKLRFYRNFLERWPSLPAWFAAPLAERVGRIRGDDSRHPSFPTSYLARSYLVFLGLRGYARFDYAWLLGSEQLILHRPGAQPSRDLGVDALVDEAASLGFNRVSAHQAMYWSVNRIVLHTGVAKAAHITHDHIEEALEAIRRFGERPDLHQFYGTPDDYRQGAAKRWVTHLHQLQVVLFHRGQVATQPRKVMPSYAPPGMLPPRMQAVTDRWLSARRLTDRPVTVVKLELAVRGFGEWLAEHDPTIQTFADVNREHCLGFLHALAEEPTEKTGRPLGPLSRIQRISGLAMFFRDTAAWEWDDVPGRPLLAAGDAPRRPARLPRYIPAPELARLMAAVLELPCPFQRTALLVARWSGARRGEIQRLAVDCLDRYPDGTARLRLPAGKTYRERIVPLHEEAATALQVLIDLRTQGPERAFIDELTGAPTRYLFMQHGKLLSGNPRGLRLSSGPPCTVSPPCGSVARSPQLPVATS